MFQRSADNPLICPTDVKPSAVGLKVLGAFNPAACVYKNETILLMRIAETCIQQKGYVSIPYYSFKNNKAQLEILNIPEDDNNLTLKDTRGVYYKGIDYLSTLSHLRLARSKDGINFKIDENPFIIPENETEAYGVEDARITQIGEEYFINYTIVSSDGYSTFLSKTTDFIKIERLDIIFPPLNKDVAIFNEKINGKYMAFHRPDNHGFGLPSIWIAESEDLIHWGKHKCLLRPNGSKLESQKIGAGAPPIKTKYGWLEIYHAKGKNNRYSLNLLLLDLNKPSLILATGKAPIMYPEKTYEKEGFFGNVIFTNGHLVLPDDTLRMYYGAADEFVCMAETKIELLLNYLR